MKSIFISHSHRSKDYAAEVKAKLRECFSEEVEVFVSSDTHDIKAGEHWKQRIRDEIVRANLIIVIADVDVMRRPWLFFEVGGA